MKKMYFISVFRLIILLSILSSCVPVKKMEYLSEKDKQDVYRYKGTEIKPKLIEPYDLLSIQAVNTDQTNSNFMQTSSIDLAVISEIGMALVAYTVDADGYIHIPVIGVIHVGGLTLSEAAIKLQKSMEGYLNQPVVKVKFVNQRIVVIGEVQVPGTYIYTKEHLNVFDALSLAGDITDFGNRKSVFLIRQDGNDIIKKRLNLRDPNFVSSEDYLLQENDILYVKPLGAKRFNLIYQPLSLVLTSVSTLILLLSFINN